MYQISGFSRSYCAHYRRIRKDVARKLLDDDALCAKIYLVPCNIRPETEWYGRGANLHQMCVEDGCSFDESVATFEYFNCNSETGKRAAFYLWEEG